MNETLEKTKSNEVVMYWQKLLSTLRQRGLLAEPQQREDAQIPVADAILLPDRCIFVLDMEHLAGIAPQSWLDPNLWMQWRAALAWRQVSVSAGGGLAITVARAIGVHTPPLPAAIPLQLESLPESYQVCLVGYARRYLADDHQALLIGSAVGKPRPNAQERAFLPLAAGHPPATIRFSVVDPQPMDFSDNEWQPRLFTLAKVPSLPADWNDATDLSARVNAERWQQRTLLAQTDLNDTAAFPLLLLTENTYSC